MPTVEDFRAHLCETSGWVDLLFLDCDFADQAVVGVTVDGRVTYDVDVLVHLTMTHLGLDRLQADEFVDHRLIGPIAYLPRGPLFMTVTGYNRQ